MNYKNLFKFCFCLLTFLVSFIFAASSLDQKVVLITGASQGLGLALAKKLAQSGYYVYGSVRKTSNLSVLQHAIRDYPENLSFVVMDVTDEMSIADAVRSIIQQSGSIDVLINNACEVCIGTAETCTIEEQKRVMDVNYFGVVRMLQAVLPIMRQQNYGHIINISSVAGFGTFPIIETYAASKFALEGLSASLATYLHNWSIKVTLIEPAGIKTNVAFTAPQGSRWNDDTNCFKEFCNSGHQAMRDSFELCQNPEEIANLIADILKDPNPVFRYQTNDISQTLAKNYFKDPTGEKTLKTVRFSNLTN